MFSRYTYLFYILDKILKEIFAKDYERGLKKVEQAKIELNSIIVFKIFKKYLLFEKQIRYLLRNKFLKLLYLRY